MKVLADLDKITCNHENLRAAHTRILRAHTWAVPPFMTAMFTVMAWWGMTNPPIWQPLALIGSLIWIGTALLASWGAILWAGLEARDLAGFHNMVITARNSECETDKPESPADPQEQHA